MNFVNYFWSMDKNVKTLLLLGGAFIAYKFYKLYELGTSIIYTFKNVTFVRPVNTNDHFIIRVRVEIMNPTKTTLPMRGVIGKLMWDGNVLSEFNTGQFTINAGISSIYMNFEVTAESVKHIVELVTKKQFPVFDVEQTNLLPFFKVTERYKVDTKASLNEAIGYNLFG